jgi:hypothetical protein
MTINIFGQEIKYNLMLKNPCSGEVEHALLYYLKKSDSVYDITDTIGTIILKKPGKYRLYSMMIGMEQEVDIDFEMNKDTLDIRKIEECLEPTSHPKFLGFCCCDKKCEGKQNDYYNNGVKRISGEFKNGLPIGKVTWYYPNGKIKEIWIYTKKGILKRKIKYDKSGKRINLE